MKVCEVLENRSGIMGLGIVATWDLEKLNYNTVSYKNFL